jgi:hypothetical protein
VKIRRDELGRFAKKVSLKKSLPRKLPPKKVPPRKLPPKKVPPRKLPSKKFPPTKVPPRKLPPKKLPPTKVPPRKLPPKKLPSTKVPSRKFPPKKFPSRKVPPKKLPPRKLPPKKLPLRKVPRKKLPPRKVPRKKLPPRKVSPKKLSPRKVSPKKLPPRKVSPKKLPPRKVPRKKLPPRKVPRRKLPLRKVPRKKVRRRRGRVLPNIPTRSRAAEVAMLAKLTLLMGEVAAFVEGADVAVKTFINSDGSVDGELRVAEMPDELRSEDGAAELVAILSEVFRAFRPFPATPPMGGKFWVSFAMRFGPQNETEVGKLAELYKKFRGLFQVGTYPAAAWHPTPIQLALATGLKTIVEGVARRQGYPPSVILIRFTWTPDGRRPAHLQGEAGGGR